MNYAHNALSLNDTRQFASGATRDKDDDKLDYEGFLSPLVLRAFAEYMHECRLRNIPQGDTIRASDNWQKGMPLNAYMKSMFRHFMEVWLSHRNGVVSVKDLMALMFNVQGYAHELLKVKTISGQPESRQLEFDFSRD